MEADIVEGREGLRRVTIDLRHVGKLDVQPRLRSPSLYSSFESAEEGTVHQQSNESDCHYCCETIG